MTTPLQPAISHKTQSFSGDASVPGDKSISHRALMLSSQVLGITEIHGLLEGEDVRHTASALRQLGVHISPHKSGIWHVEGVGVGGLRESTDILDMGNSGTSTRLLMGLVTTYSFTSFFTGDASLRGRPMARVATPLTQMGATIVARGKTQLPLAVIGTPTPLPITYRLPVASAQVKSAILLAGLNTPGTTTVIEPHPTRDHTENMLRYLGFEIEQRKQADGAIAVSVKGQQTSTFTQRRIDVPADPSSAAFLVVAALICPNSHITISNVCMNPLRTGVFTSLEAMGAKIKIRNQRQVAGETIADIEAETSKLKAVTIPAERAPSMIDEYLILAMAAACAEGETVMQGLSELRVKESDRLSALVDGLTRCSVKVRADGDDLYVTGGAIKGGAIVTTHFDHRIAMSFLVLGLVSQEPISVDDITAIRTSFPNFINLMNGLGAHIAFSRNPLSHKPMVIAVDGPAASGKGTLARRLAERFNLEYLDTGSLYRAVGLKLVYSGKDPSDRAAAIDAAHNIDAEDLANPRLRQERIGKAASVVSAYPEVRHALLEFQRRFAASGRGAVLDGRDIGTVVCPDADFKFFITATLYDRAKRRHRELQGEGIEVVFDSVLEDLRERDERDQKRTVAPLKPADDAILIDTSTLDASTVFEKVSTEVIRRYPALAAA
ncbi:MAG: 3-phosphoshikimate 1-carboxyvinyltransferase [Rickettsiales bacterium]|nr:3-phosphoshikimate 1-carboxyvinyltransferase [Rickettsiales bacterium]